jgi:hypothetical protein
MCFEHVGIQRASNKSFFMLLSSSLSDVTLLCAKRSRPHVLCNQHLFVRQDHVTFKLDFSAI